MTPADYVNEIVLPAMKDFHAGRRSRRYAYQACMAVFHIKDHLYKAGERKIENRVRQAAGSNHFDVVRSITNGAKHVETDASHEIQFRSGDDFVDRLATRQRYYSGCHASAILKAAEKSDEARTRSTCTMRVGIR